jgi:Tol biopolymer transport system component
MKTKIVLSVIIIIISQNIFPQKPVPEQKSFDYFGQIPPGDSAKIFAHGIISDTATKESALAISPNGNDVFFVRGEWPYTKIMHMVKSGSEWSLPDTAVFSKDCWATEPAFSPGGQYLYYSTSKGKSDIKYYSLWRVKKIKHGWSQPESLFDIGGDSIWEFHPSITKDGLLYFCYWNVKNWTGDIFVSLCLADKCSEPMKIDATINTDYSDVDPFIDKDGSFMIFASNRPGGYGGHDQYISFKNNDGTWTVLKNLGTKFNTREDNYDMDISPDGKYIFLYLNGDIYWMQSRNFVTSF